MLFNSHLFLLVFLPLTLLGYHLIGTTAGRRSSIVWLIAMSLVFYGWWNPIYLGLIGVSILGNYFFGRRQCARYDATGRGSRGWLAAGVALNLVLLGFFKYANFLQDTVNWFADPTGAAELVRLGNCLPRAFLDDASRIVLPLAISFFTFQQIAYLADSFYGTTRHYDFIDYCLFVCFFPQLIAGPIVHHAEVLPQFAKNPARLRADNLGIGVTLLVYGLFKKVILADHLALCASPVFDGVEAVAPGVDDGVPGCFEAWVGLVCYSGQLYFDFSGYSDMAIGLARMFGITLPVNFNSPLKAASIIEFWQRWHVTLSRFLRDYLFFWLCGKKPSAARLYLSLFVTMVLGGLWHGAGWTFVVWGALHGIYLLINHGWRRLTEAFGWSPAAGWRRGAYVVLTYLCFIVSLVLFRARSFAGALRYLAGLFAGTPALPKNWGRALTRTGLAELPADSEPTTWAGLVFDGTGELPTFAFGWSIATLVIIWTFPNTAELMHRTKPVLQRTAAPTGWRRLLAWDRTWWHALVTVALYVVCLINLTNVSEFIYWQF